MAFLLRSTQVAVVDQSGQVVWLSDEWVGDPATTASLRDGAHLPDGLDESEPLSLVQNGAGLWASGGLAPLVTGGWGPYEGVNDVDGDERLDLCTINGLVITSATQPWTFAPFPDDLPGQDVEDHNACLPDITGDGLADLLSAEWNVIDGYLFPSFGGPVSLYAGGPGGYGPTPLWTEELFFDAPYAMVAVQRDDDPELELAALTRPVYRYEGNIESSSLVLIDDLATAPQRVGAYPATIDNGFALWSWRRVQPRLVNLGDVDGDGFDDLLLPEAYGYKFDDTHTEEPHHFRIVSAASSGAVVDELATLRFDAPVTEIVAMDFGVGDVNDDGEQDLYGFACDDREGCWLQVWYGPLSTLLEGPMDSGETGDTGTHATGDTAPQAPTGDTAQPTNASDEPRPPSDASRCGCRAAAPSPPATFLRRRHSR